ncbi:MAG TPA: Uma2 family endonuclease [Pyrinomonadaceae bacterium]|nr:Uma2 family endonuclease [Pyrinomonadaceae bacterium]
MNATISENFVLDKFTAIDFLTDGSGRTVLLNDISWAEYERFLEDFAERPGWRLAYDGGKLEIMPPTPEHEEYSFSFHNFVLAYCEHFDIKLEGRGSATFRSEALDKGVEPDECFYIQSAEKIIGKKIPAKNFPMPDVAVEVDVTTESLDKFPIYAALEVPEVWIYDGKTLAFYELRGKNYHQIPRSRALPQLAAESLTGFLEMSKTEGQTAALKNFRAWLGEIKTKSEN